MQSMGVHPGRPDRQRGPPLHQQPIAEVQEAIVGAEARVDQAAGGQQVLAVGGPLGFILDLRKIGDLGRRQLDQRLGHKLEDRRPVAPGLDPGIVDYF
jgi:hypothetical protein